MTTEFKQQDIHTDHEIEISINSDGKRIWVNIDGKNAVRIYPRGECKIIINDKRK